MPEIPAPKLEDSNSELGRVAVVSYQLGEIGKKLVSSRQAATTQARIEITVPRFRRSCTIFLKIRLQG